MRAALALTLALTLTSGIALAYEKRSAPKAPTPVPTLPDLSGKPFMFARDRMLSSGWGQGPTQNGGNKCSIGREDVCKLFPHETLYCSGSGRAYCGFVFWKDEHIAFIKTQGEELTGMRVVSARILSARDRDNLDRDGFLD